MSESATEIRSQMTAIRNELAALPDAKGGKDAIGDCLDTIETELEQIELTADAARRKILHLEEELERAEETIYDMENEDDFDPWSATTQMGVLKYQTDNIIDEGIMEQVYRLMNNMNPHLLHDILAELAAPYKFK